MWCKSEKSCKKQCNQGVKNVIESINKDFEGQNLGRCFRMTFVSSKKFCKIRTTKVYCNYKLREIIVINGNCKINKLFITLKPYTFTYKLL